MPRPRMIDGVRMPHGHCDSEPRDEGAYDRFFICLARRCNIADAAERSGVSFAEVIDRFGKDAGFMRRNAEALDLAYALLEWEMLERARFGNPDPKAFNDANSLRMLARHRAERAGEGQAMKRVRPARLDSIVARLSPALKTIEQQGDTGG